MQTIAPALAFDTDNVLFGDVWLRPGLSQRDRSLVTLSVLIASGKTAQLTDHLNRALDHGLKPSEVAGVINQLAFYSGWPNAVSALTIAQAVFTARNIDMSMLRVRDETRRPPVTGEGQLEDLVEAGMADVAPKLTDLTRNVVFGDLWRRADLSPRDRSLVTIAALVAGGDERELSLHLRLGQQHGLTRAQIGEALTHLAFHTGWPKATSVLHTAHRELAEGSS